MLLKEVSWRVARALEKQPEKKYGGFDQVHMHYEVIRPASMLAGVLIPNE